MIIFKAIKKQAELWSWFEIVTSCLSYIRSLRKIKVGKDFRQCTIYLVPTVFGQCITVLCLLKYPDAYTLVPVAYLWSFGRLHLGRSQEYETDRCKSLGEKSLPSWTKLNWQRSGLLGLATSADLDASLCWSRHTRPTHMGTFEGICHKNNVNEWPETLATSSMEQALVLVQIAVHQQMPVGLVDLGARSKSGRSWVRIVHCRTSLLIFQHGFRLYYI